MKSEYSVGRMLRAAGGLLLVIASVNMVFGQTPEARKALQLLERDQSQQAIAMVKSAAEAQGTAESWFYLGYFQLKAGRYDEARASFEKAHTADNKNGLSFAGKAYVDFLEGKATEARASIERALDLSRSKDVVVLKTAAEAWMTNAKFASEAIRVLEKARDINDGDPYVHILMGDAFLLQNNGGLAVSSYERAAKNDPSNATPHYKIAMVYLLSKNTGVAIESLNKAIAIDPSYTLAYKELGELYYLRKEGEKAVEAYKKYLSLTERPEIGKIRYAFFLFMAKKYEAANEIFEDLVQQPDVSPTTLRFYAFSLFEAGDYQKSRAIFERYFLAAPSEEVEAADYAYYGNLLIRQNEDSLAIESFRQSLKLNGDQPEIKQVLAETLFKNRRYEESIDAYKTLMSARKRPMSQDYYALGRAYYFTERYEAADTVFTKLIAMQPDMAVGYLWEARAKANLDPESEDGLARPYYEKVIEIATPNPGRNSNELIEAYSYLGYYHFLKKENDRSKECWEKVLALNPNDEKAKEALRVLR